MIGSFGNSTTTSFSSTTSFSEEKGFEFDDIGVKAGLDVEVEAFELED
jgi:hypothetical protein